jgi:hypothetical protein
VPRSPEALGDLVDLTAWRRQLAVEPLWQLLSGERALRVEGYLEGEPRTVFR